MAWKLNNSASASPATVTIDLIVGNTPVTHSLNKKAGNVSVKTSAGIFIYPEIKTDPTDELNKIIIISNVAYSDARITIYPEQ